MTKYTPKIIIVGGGLSGLTLALSLARSNFNIVVLEQASHLSEVGAGIQISANGARVLHLLGHWPNSKALGLDHQSRQKLKIAT